MDLHLFADNLSNPALLFFFLGIIAVQLKSDLQIPKNSSKFISLYLLLSIGFKGGQELSHTPFDAQNFLALFSGLVLATIVPFYTFYILKRKLSIDNAGANAASYGSVSAVTFVTTIAFLEMKGIPFGGHMVAVMALMEAPSIMIGMLLIKLHSKKAGNGKKIDLKQLLTHALTNGSVLLIIGSLVIGFIANESQAEGIKPFTTDICKGFLAVFLLDMGLVCGGKIGALVSKGWFTLVFVLAIPIINGVIVAFVSTFFLEGIGNQLLLSILAASASYKAVPAAMKLAVPKANPGLYIPMALAITFPFNITLGTPLYLYVINLASGIF